MQIQKNINNSFCSPCRYSGKDLDKRMHTTPGVHATNLENVRPENLVQVDIWGWQVPREAVKISSERQTNILNFFRCVGTVTLAQ